MEMGDHYDSANEDRISETVHEEDSEDYDSEYTISERSQESDQVPLERSETFGPNELDGVVDINGPTKPNNEASVKSLSKKKSQAFNQVSPSLRSIRGSQYEVESYKSTSKRERTLSKKNGLEHEQPFNALRYIANALKSKAQERLDAKEAEKSRKEQELLAEKGARARQEQPEREQTEQDEDELGGISINVNIEKGQARASRAKTIVKLKAKDTDPSAAALTPRGGKKGRDIAFDQGPKNSK